MLPSFPAAARAVAEFAIEIDVDLLMFPLCAAGIGAAIRARWRRKWECRIARTSKRNFDLVGDTSIQHAAVQSG